MVTYEKDAFRNLRIELKMYEELTGSFRPEIYDMS